MIRALSPHTRQNFGRMESSRSMFIVEKVNDGEKGRLNDIFDFSRRQIAHRRVSKHQNIKSIDILSNASHYLPVTKKKNVILDQGRSTRATDLHGKVCLQVFWLISEKSSVSQGKHRSEC